MEEERRAAPRVKTSMVVKYGYLPQDKETLSWDTSEVKNISTKGLCITTRCLFYPKDRLKLQFRTPHEPFRWIEVSGEVVASSHLEDSYGLSVGQIYLTRVKFIDLKKEYEEAIAAYIGWVLKREGGRR
jgi:hypothetical protein